MTVIYIDDDILDLYPNANVFTTFKAYELTKFNTQFKSFTSTIKVPATDNNDRIIGHSRFVQSDSDAPYVVKSCRVLQNGVEIINNGTVVIKGATKNYYELFILSGLSFFDEIGAKKLIDLDFTGGINGAISTTTAADMNTTTGTIFPVLDYGSFDTTNYLPDYSFGTSEGSFPSIYYHTIINKIFEDAGYEKSGAIFSDAKYLATIVPFSRSDFAYGGTFVDDRVAIASKTVGQSITSGNLSTTDITFPTVIKNGSLGYWDGTSVYSVNEPDSSSGVRIFGLTVQLTIDVTVTGGTIDLIVNNGVFNQLQTGVGTGVYTSEVVGGALNLIDFSIRANVSSGTPNITVNSGQVSWVPSNVPSTGNTTYAYLNLLLPDLSQKEFLKDFSLRFGQIFQEKNGTVFCKSIDDVIADTANAVDWTNKRVRDEESITYNPNSFGKKNYLQYKNVDFQVLEDYGRGEFDIANENLQDEFVINSPFGASVTEFVGDIYMAKVNINATGLSDFEYDPGMRVLLVRDRYSYESAVRVRNDVASTTSYKVAYFEDPIQANSCSFQQSIDNEYGLYVSSLQKFKLVTRQYYLSESDIQNLDFFKPVFDKDSYYLINSVGPYSSGKLCKVVLMKI